MFDRFVVVDWSANSTPKRGRDSVWIATRDADGGLTLENPSTRRDAERMLVDHLRSGGATLLSVDFSLGYPAGTADALGLDGPPWSATAALLEEMTVDGANNANNRFEVASALNERISGSASPFWGCPPSRRTPTLVSTKPVGPGPVAEWRTVECRLRNQGRRPFSSWQLLGAGAVGSQSLLGIPMITRLAGTFAGHLEVWPFNGLHVPDVGAGSVVVAEVWPSMRPLPATEAGDVRDAQQVVAVAEWLAGLDATDSLAELFTPIVPPDRRRTVIDEEGWILGVVG